MRSVKFPVSCVALVFAFQVTSCAPKELSGLRFVTGEGASTALSRPGSETSTKVGSDETARFVLARPLSFDTDLDISIRGEGTGSIGITAYKDANRKRIIATGVFTTIKGMLMDLRLQIPAETEFSALELSADADAAFDISALSAAEKFVGARLDDGTCTVDSTTSIHLSPEGKVISATMALPSGMDASVVVKLETDGIARVVSGRGPELSVNGYEATLKAKSPLAIPAAAFGDASTVLLESEAGIASLTIAEGGKAPLSDLYAILGAPEPKGDFSLYRWDILQATLVFDFKDYDTQDRYLKRLAFYAEKPGFRGRLAGNNEIAPLHGWNAHDYSTGTLKAFFGKAAESTFPLESEELALLDVLLERGILIRGEDGRLAEGKGAIISIARESTQALRRLFIDHEATHALLFQDVEYAKLAERLWRSLGNDIRWFWRLHFAWRRYDTNDEFLTFNEMQAYLVQQPNRAVPAYYENLVKRLADAYPRHEHKLETIAPEVIVQAVNDAATLNQYLTTRWGISGGNFGRIKVIND